MFTSRLRILLGLLALALCCSVAVVEAAPTKGVAPAPAPVPAPKNSGSNKNSPTTPASNKSKLTSGAGKCKAKFKRKPGSGGWTTITPKKSIRGPKGNPALLAKTKSSNKSTPNRSTPQGTAGGGKKKRSEFELVPRTITKLYHITGATAANNIVTNGVELNCVGDFSPQDKPGFYLAAATDKDKLIKWCKTGINRECTKLVEFDYNPPTTLTVFTFNPNNQDVETWADTDDFCKYNEFAGWCMTGSKKGEAFPASELTGNYANLQTVDVVIGPIVDDYTWNQYTMRSQAALAALGAPLAVLDV